MKVKDIKEYIESIIPLEFQEEYDNSGLILGNADQEISAVLCCVDITEEILEEAVMKNCGLIISHHPLIFHGIKRITEANETQRLIIKAIRHNISLYTLHTNLDNSDRGINALLCRKLGLKNFKILTPVRNQLRKLVTFCPDDYAGKIRMVLFQAGAGHIGNYDCCSYNLRGQGTFRASDDTQPFVGEKNKLHFENETRIEVIFPAFLEQNLIKALTENHPYEEVAYDIYQLKNMFEKFGAGMIGNLDNPIELNEVFKKIKEITGIPVIRHSVAMEKKITRIALCSGSGSFLIDDAIRNGADLFLTADLKYHDFFKSEKKIVLADIGHYESEQFVKEWIYTVLIEKFPTFAVLISETYNNPVKYY